MISKTNKKRGATTDHGPNPTVKREKNLYFNFAGVGKDSRKLLKSNARLCYKFIDALVKFTDYLGPHDRLCDLNIFDTKPLTGNIDSYKFKFKLDQKNSVLYNGDEKQEEGRHFIDLGKIADHH